MIQRRAILLFAAGIVMGLGLLLLPMSPIAQVQTGKPLAKEGLLRSLGRRALSSRDVIHEIQRYGVDFHVTTSDEAEIRAKGGVYLSKQGLDAIIEAIRVNFKCPPIMSPPSDRFREKADDVHISIGGVTATCSLARLQKEPCKIMRFYDNDIEAYMECENVYLNITLYNSPPQPPIRLHGRELVGTIPPRWDRNFNDDALEIIDEHGEPIYQVFYKTPNHIHVNGFLYNGEHLLLANDDELQEQPILPTQLRYKRLFKYPSRQYEGELEKDDEKPKPQESSRPTSQTMTNSPGGVQIVGDNNVVNQGLPGRSITIAQAEKIKSALGNRKPEMIQILRLGDREAGAFAGVVAAVFSKYVGWKVEIVNYAWMMPGASGIESMISDPDLEKAVIDAFATADIKITPTSAREKKFPNAILIGYQP